MSRETLIAALEGQDVQLQRLEDGPDIDTSELVAQVQRLSSKVDDLGILYSDLDSVRDDLKDYRDAVRPDEGSDDTARAREVADLRDELAQARDVISEIGKGRDHGLSELADKHTALTNTQAIVNEQREQIKRLLERPTTDERLESLEKRHRVACADLVNARTRYKNLDKTYMERTAELHAANDRAKLASEEKEATQIARNGDVELIARLKEYAKRDERARNEAEAQLAALKAKHAKLRRACEDAIKLPLDRIGAALWQAVAGG